MFLACHEMATLACQDHIHFQRRDNHGVENVISPGSLDGRLVSGGSWKGGSYDSEAAGVWEGISKGCHVRRIMDRGTNAGSLFGRCGLRAEVQCGPRKNISRLKW